MPNQRQTVKSRSGCGRSIPRLEAARRPQHSGQDDALPRCRAGEVGGGRCGDGRGLVGERAGGTGGDGWRLMWAHRRRAGRCGPTDGWRGHHSGCSVDHLGRRDGWPRLGSLLLEALNCGRNHCGTRGRRWRRWRRRRWWRRDGAEGAAGGHAAGRHGARGHAARGHAAPALCGSSGFGGFLLFLFLVVGSHPVQDGNNHCNDECGAHGWR